MDSQRQHPTRPHPHILSILPPHSAQSPQRTASSTPVSSPGLFSPTNPRATMSSSSHTVSEGSTPAAASSPYLHPLHKVRETHTANVDRDFATGRKTINEYEVIEEIGRGKHGKVKLARDSKTGKMVAIKIIPRFSKTRRLGKVSAADAQHNTKREIAILKKIRHENVVALFEVIDDPELRKIYMVLEHVERGEIVWRKKGLPHICNFERHRIEMEMRGEKMPTGEEDWARALERKATIKETKRATARARSGPGDFWSLEMGATEEDDSDARLRYTADPPLRTVSLEGSRATSRAPSRTRSAKSSASRAPTPHPSEPDISSEPVHEEEEELETPGPLRPSHTSSTALEGTMYGAYADDPASRGRSPSMADSIISHMSSLDFNTQAHDPFVDDFSYVPCFTIEKARSTFRDTVLGLEYLHYHGVVHRDIKPANLLWTRDYRVKISDFGVSYFGRPIRDGEPDDTMSESEALDFDDDRELSKTVGTPAFFAPELCYTDLDKEPPKVSEQIDVWSLGVTLYCLIYARIPFLAEDEFSMFRKIATEEVYIPRRRLKPVDPFTDPTKTSLYKRVNHEPYRNDDDLVYEDVDESLVDLLKNMLIKNPEKRIRLRDVKRHRWVTDGIRNVMGWIDDTDPSRRTAGRRIQVDEEEIVDAVVPLNFLQRARSAVKRAVEKVIHPRAERDEGSSSSRRRATSSAASSGGDSPATVPSTPHYSRDSRRRSLRGDDYFATVTQMPSEHPLTQSVTASPYESPIEDTRTPDLGRQPSGASDESARRFHDASSVDSDMSAPVERPVLGPKPYTRHAHARSVTSVFSGLTSGGRESRTVPTTPSLDMPTEDPATAFRETREVRSAVDDSSRARSMDRAGLVFPNVDKRAEPVVGLNTTYASGNVQSPPRRPRQMRSIDLGRNIDSPPPPSPLHISTSAGPAYQHGQPKSDTNIHETQRAIAELEERPATAHQVQSRVGAGPSDTSLPQVALDGQSGEREPWGQEGNAEPTASESVEIDAAQIPCPPSPDEAIFISKGELPSTEEPTLTAVSSSSASFGAMSQTPLTSPSEVANPSFITSSGSSKDSSDPMLAFQSDPSLPALLSGASSVSADMEGDFLGSPGVVNRSSLIETADSLTPPALAKEPVGFPLEQQDWHSNVISISIDGKAAPEAAASASASHAAEEDDDESDSDGGLLMARPKKKGASRDTTPTAAPKVSLARRRDTNTSIGSTETAKKVSVHSD